MARMTTPGTPSSAYPGVAYPTSKAAVNMLTVRYAKAFPGMRINAVEPGFTATDLNMSGHQTVEQGAEIIVRMAQVEPDGPTGGYFDAQAPSPGEDQVRRVRGKPGHRNLGDPLPPGMPSAVMPPNVSAQSPP